MVDANNNAVGSVPANGHGHGHGPLFGLLPALPYLALIVLGLIGVSWTSISSAPSTTYWGMLTPVAAFTCIAARRCGWLVNASDMRRLLNVDAKANPVDADCLRRLHIRIVPARLEAVRGGSVSRGRRANRRLGRTGSAAPTYYRRRDRARTCGWWAKGRRPETDGCIGLGR
jgi:hypothetical protein